MDDDGLVRLSGQSEDLTEEARAALASELNRRNIGACQIRHKQSQGQKDKEEDRQQVVASRETHVHGIFESIAQLGIILGVATVYMVLLTIILQSTFDDAEIIDKWIMAAAFAFWALERAFVPSWKIKRTLLLALAGCFVITILVVWVRM
ncbi:MAG: hypothetical protein WAO35_05545 [Terriglobia bacterium]